MVLTVLYFMLRSPWCMGSLLDNSTLSQVPEKVKACYVIVGAFSPVMGGDGKNGRQAGPEKTRLSAGAQGRFSREGTEPSSREEKSILAFAMRRRLEKTHSASWSSQSPLAFPQPQEPFASPFGQISGQT